MSGVGLGIAGLALSAGGMGLSLGQAAKARKARKKPEKHEFLEKKPFKRPLCRTKRAIRCVWRTISRIT